ncbi:uncharacterized protein J8A68_001413 [[Candida] subhashii]|uniref:Ribosomal protein L10 n=1 Tax=[Candida] subhashii TaxID=561895 RepID=A0A8J5V4I0_9ASCO|nr:uncharacterized protein J8A68_001413 [[Candida] subhashii]KAG7665104.1 hypothetical protein J8A68_001413 [[Candida] subhashii]
MSIIRSTTSRVLSHSRVGSVLHPTVWTLRASFSTSPLSCNAAPETVISTTTTTASKPTSHLFEYGEEFSNRNTGKPLFSRKTFLVDYYKYLNDTNEIILVAHVNNINKMDNKRIRQDIIKAGGKMHFVNSNMYKLYLQSSHEEDPAAKGNRQKNKHVKHPLAILFNGPTAVISIPKADPSIVKDLVKILKQAKEKLLLIGAKVETSVMDVAEVDQLKELPSKDQLQGQLAGLLTILGGAGLVQTLQSTPSMLYLTIHAREKDLGGGKKEEEGEGEKSNDA